MKRLLELANQIKDKKLREKTIKFLKEPEISNPEIIYPKADLKEVPAWIGAHHNYPGGLLEHTLSATKIALKLADVFEETYKVKVNRDSLIAAGLLHDIMKIFILRKEGANWNFTGSVLDHADFAACELYARGFPEEVIHIIASHGGDMGSAGANPRTIEAIIFYNADVVDSSIESNIHGGSQMQFIILSPEEAKKLQESGAA